MARPRVPVECRPVTQSVRLSPATADQVCRMALKRGVSVYAFLGGIIERVMAKQRIAHPELGQHNVPSHGSTVNQVLSASPATRADRIVDPLAPR